MSYLIDSDWLIDRLKGNPEAIELLDGLASEILAVSVIAYMEALEGVHRDDDPVEARRKFDSFFGGLLLLPVTLAIAERCAAIRQHLRTAGRRVSQRGLDLLIGATAIEYGLTLVTRNRADYADIPGIALYAP